jgi:hypothetical protein
LSAQGARPSGATGPNTFEITDDRVFGPGGGALARRFARRVLAFDEVRSLALDPALNLERVARLGPGIASTPLSGFIGAGRPKNPIGLRFSKCRPIKCPVIV